jgi:adenine-specific DNA-methyltransferase
MSRKQRLELTWIGKRDRPRLEPRILVEDGALSHHVKERVTEADIFDNRLIYGDNLLALKALEQEFSGAVKCIYIDPPFNTKQAYDHYDDGLEHSIWLSLMRDRIELLHSLLAQDGSFFVHIDDNELGYLIALIDEIFGRSNRVSIITFKQSSASGPKAINPGIVTTNNFILYYVKDKVFWEPNRVFTAAARDDRYSKYIANFDDPFQDWQLITVREAFLASEKLSSWTEAKRKYGDEIDGRLDAFVLDHAERVVRTARVAPKDVNETARQALQSSIKKPGKVFRSDREGRDSYFFLNGEQLVFYKTKTRVIDGVTTTTAPLTNLWDDLLSNNLHAEGGVAFPNGKKPEALLKRIIELATDDGDLVLDSFAGSGTTGAVAQKLRRRWIMIELGEHCLTHIVPRLNRVINGDDKSGVSKAVRWTGGGGFRFLRLAPSLLERDRWGNWVIAKSYNAAMLAEAVCKLMAFTYEPSDQHYWLHGHSSERDFIYVTTQSLNHEQLRAISEEVGDERSLLICCKAFNAKADAFSNLTVNKIPQSVLRKCEWGKDDYSLRVANLPMSKPVEEVEPIGPKEPVQASLFGEGK